jgi:HD-GYP domain-containing protein (c-di-GMP phosphodiesterase class II)
MASRKTVPIAELQFGMYIAELDRAWTETPFIFQGFVLQTLEQLEILKQYCRVVFVDPDRAEVLSRLSEKIPARSSASVDLARSGQVRWTELSPVEKEYPGAARGYAAASAVVQESIVSLRSGKALPGQRLHEAVSALTESVLRNPDAMLLFSRLQENGDYVQSHALDSAIYLTAFGRFLEMSREDISLLGHLGLLQDIGKIKLPPPFMEKRERLTPIERQIAQKHVEYSAEILRATPGLPRGLPDLATLHHERLDGSGYPRRLKGKDIGLIGSMAAIVDTFDAVTAARPYAPPISPSEALKLLYGSRGVLFDSYIVEQFIRCIGPFPAGSVVELNGGEVGVVIAQNAAKRLQPRVMVVQDAAGNRLEPQKLIDLSRGVNAPDGESYRIKRTLPHSNVPIKATDLFFT